MDAYSSNEFVFSAFDLVELVQSHPAFLDGISLEQVQELQDGASEAERVHYDALENETDTPQLNLLAIEAGMANAVYRAARTIYEDEVRGPKATLYWFD